MRPRVRPEAFQEAVSAALWYDEQRAGLGDEFYDEVLSAIEAVGRSPFRYPPYEAFATDPPFRRAPVKRFPYHVIYQSSAEASAPLVVAITHAKQRPGYWADRV
jgi:hypothetical protein